jgi:hypothetical protein
MPRSFRLDAALEERLKAAAQREGVPASALIRDAISRRCDEVLDGSLYDDLKEEIGLVSLPPDAVFRSDRTREVFSEILLRKHGPKSQRTPRDTG